MDTHGAPSWRSEQSAGGVADLSSLTGRLRQQLVRHVTVASGDTSEENIRHPDTSDAEGTTTKTCYVFVYSVFVCDFGFVPH